MASTSSPTTEEAARTGPRTRQRAEKYYGIIRQALTKIAEEHQVRVLWAAEYGSGANGLDGPQSDFDIAFVYVRPLPSYFSIDPQVSEKKSTIRIEEYSIHYDDSSSSPSSSSSSSSSSSLSSSESQSSLEMDAQGFDLPYALKMLRDGNLTLLDCLFAPFPIVGSEADRRSSPAVELLYEGCLRILSAQPFLSLKALAHQLYNKAKNHDAKFFGGRWSANPNSTPVSALHKKYFYIIVPLLRLLWLRNHHPSAPSAAAFTLPPMDFDVVLQEWPELADNPGLQQLVARKRAGSLQESKETSISDLDAPLTHLFKDLQPFLFSLTSLSGAQRQIAADWDQLYFQLLFAAFSIPVPA